MQALAGDDDDEAAPLVLALAERAFHRWLEDTCLDDANEAFESEGSPFASREDEVLAVVSIDPQRRLRRVAQITPLLCRAGQSRLPAAACARSKSGSCAATTSRARGR